MFENRKRTVVSIVAVFALFSVCAGMVAASEKTGNPVKASTTWNVEITDMGYDPSFLDINVGDTVIWWNNDTVNSDNHTVTWDSGSEPNSGLIAPGNSWSHTFNTEDTFLYHDDTDGSNTGTVDVSAPAPEMPIGIVFGLGMIGVFSMVFFCAWRRK